MAIPQSAPAQQPSGEDPNFKAISAPWEKFQKNKTDMIIKKFKSNVEDLYDAILKEWKKANEPSIERAIKDAFLDKLENFLMNEKSDDGIDDCVLWVILCTAAENDEQNESTEADIIKTILRRRPYLAFENVSTAPMTASCKFQDIHPKCTGLKRNMRSPFRDAAKANNTLALPHFMDGIQSYCNDVVRERKNFRPYPAWLKLDPSSMTSEELYLQIVRGALPRGEPTALALAAGADGNGEALEHLLKRVPDIVDANDNTFKSVVEKGKANIVEKFLRHSNAHGLFARSEHIIEAIHLVSQGGEPKSRLDIVLSLIRVAKEKAPDYFDVDVAGAIIRDELSEAWEALVSGVPNIPCFVLHQAVQHGRLNLVEQLLTKHPHFVSKRHDLLAPDMPGNATGYYPLWYNNMHWHNRKWEVRAEQLDDVRVKIRSEVITHTVRQARRMKSLSDILAESGARELCFDLSHINFKLDRVSEFAQSLINHREGEELFQYEETLKYADFPVLDINPDDRDEVQLNRFLPVERREIFQILDWLRDKKKVKRILSLKVPDRLINPHNEVEIATKVDLFKVEVLDWRLLDMSISIFSHEVKNRLTELSLYASGKRSETGDAKSCSEVTKHIRREFKNKADTRGFTKLDSSNISIESQFWNPVHRMENLDEMYAYTRAKKANENTQNVDDNAQEMAPFRATKIAIIDNGILGISRSIGRLPEDRYLSHGVDTTSSDSRAGSTAMTAAELQDYFLANKSVASRIKGGRTFVDESYKLSPWFFASNPHGTQMANLICAIDPLCELYVAKVHDGQYGMTAGRVARAIEWAVAQDVDVISMSFTIISKEENAELKKALNLAGNRGIAILCSVHDEGTKVDDAWPAGHQGDHMIVVAACDEYGRILREMNETKYNFMLNGKNVAAGVIPFLEPNERITGSSVATALAAGLSSLILACDRLVDPKENVHKANNRGRAPSIKLRLKAMQATDNSKYVVLDKFAGIDQITQLSRVDIIEAVLKSWHNMWQWS
ncbi:hypothetical protein O1611_g552 [Lasiodiplodia mahajangana]|uniref:Uncharacterized protein n=1 Tax=Lasiodiplodia mahajangana TaxID=1108764 RepID=A0ACC2JZV7_9PEZI|nr:hypothetical protein O1611_g552 [Lasiodiplodia mahajangana]